MFGYIKPDTDNLKVRQFGLYKSIYCGICKTGGKTISRLTRFLLSYDFVFIASLRLAFTKENYSLEVGRCVYNPLVKKNIMEKNNALIYTSAAFGVLLYYKFLDDINDNKGVKRWIRYLALPLFARMRKRALRLYPQLDKIVSVHLDELNLIEKDALTLDKKSSPDAAADCFARLTAGILCFGLSDDEVRIAKECGYHLGRYIYLIDACDDFEDDIKTGSYNPLKEIFETPETMYANPELIDKTLTDSMNAFLLSYSLLEPFDTDLNEIIENTIILGSFKIQRKILYKENLN